MAIADIMGPRNPREAALLHRIARAFGLPTDEIVNAPIVPAELGSSRPVALPAEPPAPAQAASVMTAAEDPRKLLQIESGTPLSADFVRRQFNLLSEKLSSDKLATAGPEFAALAKAKLVAVRSAASKLLEQWNETLDSGTATTATPELR